MVARGASPWWTTARESTEPRRGDRAHAVWRVLSPLRGSWVSCGGPVQGLAPLATVCRRSAAENRSITTHTQHSYGFGFAAGFHLTGTSFACFGPGVLRPSVT